MRMNRIRKMRRHMKRTSIAKDLPGRCQGWRTGSVLHFLFLSFLLAGVYPAFTATAGTETRYDVLAKGLTIGSVVTIQKAAGAGDGEPRIHYENRTDVNASFLWFGYRSSTTERAEIRGNTLVGYARRGQENGTPVDVEGRLAGETFRFTVMGEGGSRTVSIPRSSYDHSTLECPEATMDFGPDGKSTLRILDTEYLAVVRRSYQLVKEDICRVGGREYRCRVVDFHDPHKSCRRWIGRDGDAVVMFRQDGKGKSGSYSVRATGVSRFP
jgi:hypothetical protein